MSIEELRKAYESAKTRTEQDELLELMSKEYERGGLR